MSTEQSSLDATCAYSALTESATLSAKILLSVYMHISEIDFAFMFLEPYLYVNNVDVDAKQRFFFSILDAKMAMLHEKLLPKILLKT